MTLATGSTLGRFQIVSPLGQGGMATVYKAFQPALDRYVALKILRAGLTDDPEQRERFEREAKAIARLRHPNIVQVFDFDIVEGHSFLVIEFIDGGTLKQKLAELRSAGQRLQRKETIRVISEVGEALDAAHQQGIVHRDVKPSNVLMSRSGRAVMADFGIARMLTATQQTQTGVGIGTPEYMSPEQGQGLTVDQRSDIYSLGVMAYELLTGSVPFQADTPLAIVLAHVRDPLPLPSRVDPTIGPEIEQVLLKAMAKTPDDRYATASDFAKALEAANEGRTTAPLPSATAPAAAAGPATAQGTSATPAAGAAAPASAVAPAQPRADLSRTAQAAARWQIGLALRLIGIVFLLVELLLAARIALRPLGSEIGASVVTQVRTFTDPLVAPFAGIGSSLLADPALTAKVDVAAIIALVVVFVVSRVIDAGGQMLLRRYTSSTRA